MNPRTLCACHPVASISSASVAPLARPISSRIFAPLLSARGVLACLRALLSTAFLVLVALAVALPSFAGLASFLALPALAFFAPLGAPFFGLVFFFKVAFSGATGAPCSATVAAVLASVFVMFVLVILSAVITAHDIHHSGSQTKQVESAVRRND